MESISAQRRSELVRGTMRTSLKLELRDRYAVDNASLSAWRHGGAGALAELLAPTLAKSRRRISAGLTLRRVKVISEPPSEYMRYALDVTSSLVDIGEDIRWLPRRLTSELLLPGNDFFVIDDAFVIFNVMDGDDGPAEQQYSADPDLTARCRGAFEAAWEAAVPHRNYHPA